jgi:DNA (cytosine-5)-methyltransferase 1
MLLPTPQARDGARGTSGSPTARRAAGRQVNLPDVLTSPQVLPTLGGMTVTGSTGLSSTPSALGAKDCTRQAHHSGPSLPKEARRLPTLGASDARRTGHPDGTGHTPTPAPEMPVIADPEVLLPTPRATDGAKGAPAQRGSKGDLMLPPAIIRLLFPPATNATSVSVKTATRMGPQQRGAVSAAWTGESMPRP